MNIDFINIDKSEPYMLFHELYNKAITAGENQAQAITISSYDNDENEVDSRYVNLKRVDGKEFIFFTNYNSPKSRQFLSHSQISAVIFWKQTNIQVRIKAIISKTSQIYSDNYFSKRSFEKNALSVSSNQSEKIDTYNQVIANYNKALKKNNLSKRPSYWGGFAFTPYYFEFWQGHELRINSRKAYKLNDNNWEVSILQP